MKSYALIAALICGGITLTLVFWPREQGLNGQEKKEKKRTGFASDREGPDVGGAVAFDGARAMKYLKAICDIGPRMSGTEGMDKQQALIKKHFEDLGYKVIEQKFNAKQISKPAPIEMTNLIISFFPEKKRRVILCCHYDTRPIADQEPDPRKWREPFVSANDGGSGVAFLMELAHHMKDLKTNVGVDFVIFDGEEYIFEPRRDEYFFGSKYFAQSWKKGKVGPDYVGAVLLDMIAGKNAQFPVEGYSFSRAKTLAVTLWNIADELKVKRFVHSVGSNVMDDHLALLNVGIPAVDIIDFDYPHWHKLGDTPANCAPEPMIDVARVLNVWLQTVK